MLQTAPNRAEDAAEDSSVLESDVARLQAEVLELQRTLHARSAELAGADAHIARLEEKILKLKEAQRELKRLKKEQQALRKSAERKIGRILLAPFRMLQSFLPKRESQKQTTDYQKWLDRHRPSQADLEKMRSQARAFTLKPLISVITPVFNTPVQWLSEAIDSVLAQTYENWELLLIDDASTAGPTIEFLAQITQRDSRIRVIRREANGGISIASNDGLAQAHGEWIGLLDHDDLLEPDALFQTVKLLQTNDEVDLVYSDEDKLTEDGFASPAFKPDWSPDFFLSYNYICHFTTFRRELAQDVGGFRSEFDGSQDYDLFLRMIEKTKRIQHVPHVLYHWRRTENSVADNIRRKPGALEAGRQAIAGHLARTGQRADVTIDRQTHAYRVRRDLVKSEKISIIVAPGNPSSVEAMKAKTDYPNFEIITIERSETKLAVRQTNGPWILFLDSGIEPIDREWLTLMAEHVQRPEVGAVGARVISSGDTVEHAGLVVGGEAMVQPAFQGFSADAPGVCRQLQITRNYSAVSRACMLTRREVFQEVGGFDEELAGSLADVDLCLKMRRAGYLVVYTPFVKLYRGTSRAEERIGDRFADLMRQRWGDVLAGDPYYNPNLSRARADFSIGN